jgi:hypothetical protein
VTRGRANEVIATRGKRIILCRSINDLARFAPMTCFDRRNHLCNHDIRVDQSARTEPATDHVHHTANTQFAPIAEVAARP